MVKPEEPDPFDPERRRGISLCPGHNATRRRDTQGDVPKRDYYDDPAAPKANSIVVAVTAAVQNPLGELLLIQRTDNGLWALPGGAQDLG